VAEIAVAVFASFCMILNFAKGKTEAVVAFAGKCAKKAHVDLAVKMQNVSKICVLGKLIELRFVSSYKHLGTMFVPGGSLSFEAIIRSSIISSETRRLRKIVLRGSNLSVPRKITVIKTYILSKGLFQCGSWDTLPPKIFRKFHHAIMSCYRSLDKTVDIDNLDKDDDVIFKFGLIAPMTYLRYSRLCLFLRVIKKAPEFLIKLCLASSTLAGGWCDALMSDFRWLSLGPQFSEMANKNMSFLDWYELFKSDVSSFGKAIKKWTISPFANIVDTWAKALPPTYVSDESYQCNQCSCAFSTFQKLQLHLWKVHKVRNPIGKYINTTHCAICMKEFWTRDRLLNHLKYRSKVCMSNIFLLLSPVLSDDLEMKYNEEARVNAAKLASQGKRRHHACLPCVQLVGPLPMVMCTDLAGGKHHPLGVGRSYGIVV
jgi:hypothetical protein